MTAKEVIKEPGSFYLSVPSSPHSHKMAAAAPISHILTTAFESCRTWMGDGGSNLHKHFSFFEEKNTSENPPPPPGSLLSSIGPDRDIPKLNHHEVMFAKKLELPYMIQQSHS